MAATVKMGVDVSGFKSGMQQAQQSAKTLQAQMKANEAQFKATGDKEKYVAEQSKLLKAQLDAQKTAAKNAEQAMKAMRDAGISETSAEYQRLATQLANAQAAIYNTSAAMNTLAASESNASGGAQNLGNNLSSINKNVSMENVTGALNKISSGLESIGKKAIEAGKAIWDAMLDSAAYADDVNTMADMLGLTTQEVQQMQYVANRFEAPVETVAKTWKKLRMNMTSDNAEIAEGFRELGVQTHEIISGKYGQAAGAMRNYKDVFWETGEAIMQIADEAERERMAQTLLGRSWDELIPLFKAGRAAYEDALEAAPTNSEDAIQNAAELNDKIAELEQSFRVLKTEVLGEIAPALTKAATILENLVNSITEYLKTDEGQAALKNIENVISSIVDDIANIDPEDVVNKFTGLLQGVVDAFNWIKENWSSVKFGIEAIGIAFGTIKIVGLASNVTKLVNGLSGLSGSAGGGAGAGAGGGAAGAGGSAAGNAAGSAAGSAGVTLGAKIYAALNGTGALGNAAWGLGVPAAILALALAPEIINAGKLEEKWRSDQTRREAQVALVEAMNSANASFTKRATAAVGLAKDEYGNEKKNFIGRSYTEMTDDHIALLMSLQERQGQQMAELQYALLGKTTMGNDAWLQLNRFWNGEMMSQMEVDDLLTVIDDAILGLEMRKWQKMFEEEQPNTQQVYQYGGDFTYLTGRTGGGWVSYTGADGKTYWRRAGYSDDRSRGEQEPVEVPVTPVVGEETKSILEEQLNALNITVGVMPILGRAGISGGIGGILGAMLGGSHSNGLWNVPWDGYPAILHRGERVLTASENQRYTYNNYFGTVNLNNGLEIDALTESIERRNQRQRSGYGAM